MSDLRPGIYLDHCHPPSTRRDIVIGISIAVTLSLVIWVGIVLLVRLILRI